MSDTKLTLPVDHVSDTAWMVAEMRAMESERPDARFQDRLARKLVGNKGKEIMDKMPEEFRSEWMLTIRTVAIDAFLEKEIKAGLDCVINLATGLDTRPYRLPLPSTLRWVEVDFSPVVAYKNERLADEKPNCHLERVPLDLSDAEKRRELILRLGREVKRALVLTEGLLPYLDEVTVTGLARDLHDAKTIAWWVQDEVHPGFLAWAQKHLGLGGEGKTSLRWAPEEGHGFFAPYGWTEAAFRSFTELSREIGREPAGRFASAPPELFEKSGIVLLERERAGTA